jgi:hypothetical protein
MEINGAKVVDATKPLTIEILPKDIQKGNNKDPGACAAAQACLRQLHATAARVHIGRTYLMIDKKWLRFNTPRSLRSEIIAFDRGGAFAPGEYTLKPLQPSERAKRGKRAGSADKTDRNGRRNTKKRPRAKHVVTGIREHGANR